jgi:hypothetical protein
MGSNLGEMGEMGGEYILFKHVWGEVVPIPFGQ